MVFSEFLKGKTSRTEDTKQLLPKLQPLSLTEIKATGDSTPHDLLSVINRELVQHDSVLAYFKVARKSNYKENHRVRTTLVFDDAKLWNDFYDTMVTKNAMLCEMVGKAEGE